MSEHSTLERFNALDPTEAKRQLAACLDVDRWVDDVEAGRPYAARQALVDSADRAARELTDAEVDAALAGHPRIGERAQAGHNVEASAREQAAVDRSDAEVAARLHAGNTAYEERFDRVFLIRAAGRTAPQILAELERRLGNDDESERAEVVDNLRQIALLRLEQVV
ncbi:2-oxo-4-hydroxy-4-carboxy-5-ureidoimidazoline decarboxylase [Knoellia sp. CPCC 206453]|uniref:2-oxo-4-hydroxy-4-carboxy-5-ureidoimidazoline decarboxylase n=1 Tax=Knoellia pratensis TaxID=3404796 RepID=UPI0036211830